MISSLHFFWETPPPRCVGIDRGILSQPALGQVFVITHAIAGRMDDQNPLVAGHGDGAIHAGGDFHLTPFGSPGTNDGPTCRK